MADNSKPDTHSLRPTALNLLDLSSPGKRDNSGKQPSASSNESTDDGVSHQNSSGPGGPKRKKRRFIDTPVDSVNRQRQDYALRMKLGNDLRMKMMTRQQPQPFMPRPGMPMPAFNGMIQPSMMPMPYPYMMPMMYQMPIQQQMMMQAQMQQQQQFAQNQGQPTFQFAQPQSSTQPQLDLVPQSPLNAFPPASPMTMAAPFLLSPNMAYMPMSVFQQPTQATPGELPKPQKNTPQQKNQPSNKIEDRKATQTQSFSQRDKNNDDDVLSSDLVNQAMPNISSEKSSSNPQPVNFKVPRLPPQNRPHLTLAVPQSPMLGANLLMSPTTDLSAFMAQSPTHGRGISPETPTRVLRRGML